MCGINGFITDEPFSEEVNRKLIQIMNNSIVHRGPDDEGEYVERNPKVSIIMGVYNCENTLEESLDSIIMQTYKNWEFIICDDGSTDGTFEIAKRYSDIHENVILLKNDCNRGITYTLNYCLKYAAGEFIARQDGDDRSVPERLEKEVEFLLMNPEYSVVSTAYSFFDESGIWGRIYPVEKPEFKDFVRSSPFAHAPCMIRSQVIKAVGGYDDRPRTLRVEDYDLWFRLYAKGYRGYNLKEVLYEVREDKKAINRRKYSCRLNEAYVKFNGYRMLHLPVFSYIYVLKPLIVGLVPSSIYRAYRKKHYSASVAEDGSPRRILQITGGMDTGGAETMIMQLYRKIDRSKLQFDFVSFTEDTCLFDEEIRALGGRIFYIASPQKSNLIKFVTDLYQLIRQHSPYHAVHAHTLFNSGLALLAARLAGVKLRVCHSHSTSDNNYSLWTRKLYFLFMRGLIKLNANKKVACSNPAGKFLFGGQSGNKQKFTIIHNAVDLVPYRSVDQCDLALIRKELEIGGDTLVLGHVGRFGKEKNHAFLIWLAEFLKSKGINYKLLLIGQGKQKEQIESTVREKELDSQVIFLNYQKNIPLFMRMFDVFVFPSFFEGLGIVLVEAQAAGTPCVISDTIPEECDMGLGLITRLKLEDGVEHWSDTILRKSKMEKLPIETSIEGIIQKGYNLNDTVKTLLNLYKIPV